MALYLNRLALEIPFSYSLRCSEKGWVLPWFVEVCLVAVEKKLLIKCEKNSDVQMHRKTNRRHFTDGQKSFISSDTFKLKKNIGKLSTMNYVEYRIYR